MGVKPAFPPSLVVQVKALACELPHTLGLPLSHSRLEAGELSDNDLRDQAARAIRGRAATLFGAGYGTSTIECHMAELDRQKLQPLLEEIADMVSPETRGQADETGFSLV